MINDLADISEKHVFSLGMITLKVNRFEVIVEVNTFLSCNKFRKFRILIWEKKETIMEAVIGIDEAVLDIKTDKDLIITRPYVLCKG